MARGTRNGLSLDNREQDLLFALGSISFRNTLKGLEDYSHEQGEAFDDEKKTEALAECAKNSPLGFLFCLPSVIEDNLAGFSDEEQLEQAVVVCLEILKEQFSQNDSEFWERHLTSGQSTNA